MAKTWPVSYQNSLLVSKIHIHSLYLLVDLLQNTPFFQKSTRATAKTLRKGTQYSWASDMFKVTTLSQKHCGTLRTCSSCSHTSLWHKVRHTWKKKKHIEVSWVKEEVVKPEKGNITLISSPGRSQWIRSYSYISCFQTWKTIYVL